MKKNKNMRSQFPVLVCEVQERMSIAVIRSLGRAGYPVHACSLHSNALGFHSNYVDQSVVCPLFDSDDFMPWLREYCKKHAISCIIPTENLLLAIRSDFEYFKHLFPLSKEETIVYKGMSKFDLFQTLRDKYSGMVGQQTHLPQIILIEKDKGVEINALGYLQTPLFIKADGCHSLSGSESITQKAESSEDALLLINEGLGHVDKLLVQGFVQGVGVGVFLLRWQGVILAKFMHMRLHEIPIQGWSSYRKSWWHQEIYNDAELKLEAMNWEGVAMMEYRWDEATNEFALIEMNGRFWGSLHLALYSDVDFPTLLLDAFHEFNDVQSLPVKQNVYCRNVVLELRYVGSQLKKPGITIFSKLSIIMEFILLTLNPTIKSDLFFPGDRRLFWMDIGDKILSIFDRLGMKIK